jgi:cell division septal protein FtsQ
LKLKLSESGNGNKKWILLKSLVWIFSFLILSVLVLVAVESLVKSNFFNISKIDIILSGADQDRDLLSQELLKMNQEIEKFYGSNLWEVNVDQIGKSLMKSSWVGDFTIVKNWPNQLEIKIEISPILFVTKTKSKTYLFFNSQKRAHETHVDFEELSLRFPELVTESDKLEEDVILSTYHALGLLKQRKHLSIQNIKKIYWNSRKGFRLQLREPNTEVLLGFLDEPDRLDRVTRVMDYLKEHKIEARVIDSNFTKKVLVRLRNQL